MPLNQPANLWHNLFDYERGQFRWRKEDRQFARCFVCYVGEQEIGLIPVEVPENDLEWQNWWAAAYRRHGVLSLKVLQDEVEERFKKSLLRK